MGMNKQTKSNRGYYAFGDKHPVLDNLYFNYYRGSDDFEYWISQKALSKVKERRTKYEKENGTVRAADYRRRNEEKVRKAKRRWQLNNAEKIRGYSRKWWADSRKNDPFMRAADSIRGRCREIFKIMGKQKSKKSTEILGASFSEVKKHLESKFIGNMSWDNYGKWHIDHIIPLSCATTEEGLIKLCHYTNLQPLWAYDNLSKGNKLVLS
jgi:hypothetical protein